MSAGSLPPIPPCARILVVDDDELMCQFLERLLGRRAFTVFTETSSKLALARLAVEDFDVVISDLNMEGLDGLAFTKRVIDVRPETPVILITGASTVELAISAVRAGAWDFLAKPVDIKLLGISIERACEHRQLKKELRLLRTQVTGEVDTGPVVPTRGSC